MAQSVAAGSPGGDVPETIGVRTDVVIRAYRMIGVDLQKEVHEAIRADFDAYPALWGLSRPDPNIDHRRVANLQAFLRRRGAARPVTWMLPGNDHVITGHYRYLP